MMADLDDLYQELIVDHNRRPRNKRQLERANRQAEGFNPLCGDRVKVFLRLEEDVVKEIAFEGSGCAISTASASLMTESLKGRTLAEARKLFEKFHKLITGQDSSDGGGPALGKLEVFSTVNRYPARVKCAGLAWHTVKSALDNKNEVVSTE